MVVHRPTVITPPSCSRPTDKQTRVRPKENPCLTEENTTVGEHWVQATCMVRDDPSLLTSRVFYTSLEHQPPVDVVRFMLSVNPKLANIPKEGPTALQVAVQNQASLEVIELLLEACPFALCVTNPKHAMDPLSYASTLHTRIFGELSLWKLVSHNIVPSYDISFFLECYRSDEPELLELLSRPLSEWVSKHQLARRKKSFLSPQNQRKREQQLISHDYKRQQSLNESPLMSSGSYSTQELSSSSIAGPQSGYMDGKQIDREEFNNVKLLCAQVLKGQKKLSKHVKACQEQWKNLEQEREEARKDATSDTRATMETFREEVLQDVKQAQKDQFYRQLIALDMKEKAFYAKVRNIGESQRCECRDHCESELKKMTEWQSTMESWRQATEEQIRETKLVLDHQVQVNAHFRTDFGEWIEEHEREHQDNVGFACSTGRYSDDDLEEYAYDENDIREYDDVHEYEGFEVTECNYIKEGGYDDNEEEEEEENETTPILFASDLGETKDWSLLYSEYDSAEQRDLALDREYNAVDLTCGSNRHGLNRQSQRTTKRSWNPLARRRIPLCRIKF